jgi:hypothetical protein
MGIALTLSLFGHVAPGEGEKPGICGDEATINDRWARYSTVAFLRAFLEEDVCP